ncbi:MAG: V-type ATPase subunit [Firmicutes bacterium]|nr:V-type ATPase subunit [Bacillota bacterium]
MSDYIFPCVVIRSREVDLLSREELLRLLDLKSVQDIMNVLADHGYGDGKEQENPRDFEKVLSDNMKETYDTINSTIPDEKELSFFKYPNDYHNLKVLLKAEFLKSDASHLLIDSGTIPADKLQDMLRRRDFSLMTLEMRQAVDEAIELFAKSRDPQEIDLRLDKACYKDMLTDAEESGNQFLQEYVKKLIDSLNIDAFARLKEIGKPRAFFRRVFLDGGNLDENAVEQKAVAIVNEVTLSGVEKYLDTQRMEFVKDALYVPFGIEPVVGYLEAKEAEVMNLRMILTGKISGMDDALIRERLRETYV